MSGSNLTGWQAIQGEVLRRIHAREWPPGHVIPGEVALAAEFGCARATVNRALQSLADSGLLERRRKAGTRVALHPVSRATLDIPVIRRDIHDSGRDYGYRLMGRATKQPGEGPLIGQNCLHLTALHLANAAPFVIEDRLINLAAVPIAADQDFAKISANEWLLAHVPYTHGDIKFMAAAASGAEAELLGCAPGAPVFVIERSTWDHDQTITFVRLIYAPGYHLHTGIGPAL